MSQTTKCFGDGRPPASELEASGYYSGLHCRPVLIARTGSPWKEPPGPYPLLQYRGLKTVGDHPTMTPAVWEGSGNDSGLALRIHSILESHDVKWTSTDVARIPYTTYSHPRGDDGVEDRKAVVLWIGVTPGTLSHERGLAVADECKVVLVESGILDVEVEIRESIVTRYATSGPKLHKPGGAGYQCAAYVHDKLMPTLGLPICSADTPWGPEGTGGFYVTDENAKLYFVTARHVLFKAGAGAESSGDHAPYKYDGEVSDSSYEGPHINVALLGCEAFNNYIEEIREALRTQESAIETWVRGTGFSEEWSVRQRNAEKARDTVEALKQLYSEVKSPEWSDIKNRIIGHVRFSPPLQYGAGLHGYTQDYALVEVDRSKIDAENYAGNSIALGPELWNPGLIRHMMGVFGRGRRSNLRPLDGLYKVQGIIPDEDLRRLAILDTGGKGNSVEHSSAPQCLAVLKRGNGTGMTLGHANNFMSYVRNYFDDGRPPKTSKEWAIFPSDLEYGSPRRSRPFSGPGDCGAGIVDGFGRLGGLITGGDGNGTADGLSSITYATPISFIFDSLKEHGYDVMLEVTAEDAKSTL